MLKQIAFEGISKHGIDAPLFCELMHYGQHGGVFDASLLGNILDSNVMHNVKVDQVDTLGDACLLEISQGRVFLPLHCF